MGALSLPCRTLGSFLAPMGAALALFGAAVSLFLSRCRAPLVPALALGCLGFAIIGCGTSLVPAFSVTNSFLCARRDIFGPKLDLRALGTQLLQFPLFLLDLGGSWDRDYLWWIRRVVRHDSNGVGAVER